MARFAVPFILLSITGTILAGILNTIIFSFNFGVSAPIRSTIYFLLIDVFMFVGLIELQLRRKSASRRMLSYFTSAGSKKIHPSRIDALGRNAVEFDKGEAAHIYFDQLKRTW